MVIEQSWINWHRTRLRTIIFNTTDASISGNKLAEFCFCTNETKIVLYAAEMVIQKIYNPQNAPIQLVKQKFKEAISMTTKVLMQCINLIIRSVCGCTVVMLLLEIKEFICIFFP